MLPKHQEIHRASPPQREELDAFLLGIEADAVRRRRLDGEAVERGAEDALALFEALYAENPYDGCVAVHVERLRAGARSTEIAMTEK